MGLTPLKRFAQAALVLLSAACDRTVVTPVGTVLTEWQGAPIHGAPLEHVAVSMCIRGPLIEGDGHYRVEFDRGPGEPLLRDAGAAPQPTLVMRDVKITLETNQRFAVTAHCSDAPFGSEDPATHVFVAKTYCAVTFTRKNGDETYDSGVGISATGDVDGLGGGTGMAQWITQRC